MPEANFLVQRVYRATFSQRDGNDIPIFYEDQEIGALCPLAGAEKEVSALTVYQKAVLDFEKTQEEQNYIGPTFQFERDYVAIKVEWQSAYAEYRKTSSYWGEYCHEDHLPISHQDVISEPSKIVIEKSTNVRTSRHRDALAKYATYPNPTDKFLFLYHCLELDFDHKILAKIKSLNENNAIQLGTLVKDLRLDDISRLMYMMEDVPLSVLEPFVFLIRSHGDAAKRLFYEFGKEDSNPLKEYEDFEKLIINSPAITRDAFIEVKRQHQTIVNPKDNYDKIIRKCCCYWIYRIRCSIAHNKIGDYHIQTAEDISFVINFGIPLVRNVVGHHFSAS